MDISTGYKNAVAEQVRTQLDYGVIHLYTGAKPASPDDAEAGSLLAIITNNGGAFTPGAQANGLRFGAAVDGLISILAGQTWKTDACLATGQVGWGRFYANARTQGASTTAVRVDFTVSTSGADLNLVTTQCNLGLPFVIQNFSIEIR